MHQLNLEISRHIGMAYSATELYFSHNVQGVPSPPPPPTTTKTNYRTFQIVKHTLTHVRVLDIWW